MNDLMPLETLFEIEVGTDLPLPAELETLYGRLQFPPDPGRPYIYANFVETLDGVVSLGMPGQSGGGEISGFNRHDKMVMGLLRAAADAVIVGAGTLRDVPRHLWTAEHIFPPLASAYQQFRAALGKSKSPLNVVVTASGELDLRLPVFSSGGVPVLIATTRKGASKLRESGPPSWVQVVAVVGDGPLGARAILETVGQACAGDLILVEGGPHLMGDFLAELRLDELFLTLAPQVAGRDASLHRPGFVAGRSFAPEHALWATLVGVKHGESHLFLRYRFDRTSAP